MVDRFENFTVTILRLNKLIQKIKLLEMTEYGLRAVHVMCVYYLDLHREGLTASELARLTLEDKAAISRALGTLRDRGYINYNSRRYNSKVVLTPRGEGVARHISNRAESAVEAGGNGLSEQDRAVLYSSLSRITKHLEDYYRDLQKKKNINIDAED